MFFLVSKLIEVQQLPYLLLWGLFVFTTPVAGGATSGCKYPVDWGGQWFQSGRGSLGAVLVNRTHFSNGVCIEEGKAKRYVVYIEQDRCHKCMVINQKHPNVIQYKESYCDPHTRDLKELCLGITGDATLYSMFRLHAEVISCPFKGPHTFTYNKGYGECKDPVSQVDSCADDSRLLFRQQACPDIKKSESKEEELICLGSWKEGSNHYLVGKVNHAHANSDEDRYRCFIYERPSKMRQGLISYTKNVKNHTLLLSMSADATCQGLSTTEEGGKTMKLDKVNHGSKKCKFPSWMTEKSHWHTLDFAQSYIVFRRNTSIKISNGTSVPENLEERGHTDLRLVCHSYESYTDTNDRHEEHHGGHQKEHHDHANDVTIIVHFTTGCRSGYRCMRIFKRDNHVLQIQFGSDALIPEEACGNYYWDSMKASFITLVAQGDVKGSCGPIGRYLIPSMSEGSQPPCASLDKQGVPSSALTHLTVGCSQYDILEMHEACQNNIKRYQCHGEWQSGGVTYVVASPTSRASRSPRRFCFAYSPSSFTSEVSSSSSPESDASQMVFTARHDTCISTQLDAHYTLNATRIGKCMEASSRSSHGSRLCSSLGVGPLLLALWAASTFLLRWTSSL